MVWHVDRTRLSGFVFKVVKAEGKDSYICFSSENPWYAVVNKNKAESVMKTLKDLQK